MMCSHSMAPRTTAQRATPVTVGAQHVLWQTLLDAPDLGVSTQQLAEITGMGRSWVYQRLQDHATAGRVTRTRPGHWKATPPPRAHSE